MRLFVALELPGAARRELERKLASARQGLPKARWTSVEQLHVTLLFLGETDAELCTALDRAFEPACAGSFPPGRPARVLWVGLECGAELPAMQRRIEAAACEVLSRPPEPRPYHPHVTVGRCRSPWSRSAAARFSAALEGCHAASFGVDRAVLMESRLDASGARYAVVSAYPLGAA
jgi:RNA 2',3'-cyclic 3'-phosphodiesterase